MDLKRIIEKRDTAAGQVFDGTILTLIVISMVGFSLETLPGLPTTTRRVLKILEIGTVAVFTIEYVLRLALADNRLRFATSFFGLVDLMAILPFYVAAGIDLRSIRAFRLL